MRRALIVSLLLALAGCDQLSPAEQAEVAYAANQFDKAVVAFEAALETAEPADRPHLKARLGLALQFTGDMKQAEARLREAIAEGQPATVALAQRYLGRLLADTGDHDGALAAYDAAHAWLAENGPEADLLKMQIHRAGLAWFTGDFEAAWSAYSDVYHRASASDAAGQRANALDGMAMLIGYAGETASADMLYEQAITIYDAAGNSSAEARALAGRAVLALNTERLEKAQAFAKRALEIANRNQLAEIITQAGVIQAMIDVAGGRWDAALSRLEAINASPPSNPSILEVIRLAELQALVGAERWSTFVERSADFTPQQSESRSMLATLKAAHAHAHARPADRRRALEEAVEHFEAVRSSLGVEQLGTVFTRQRLAAYEALIGILAEAGEHDAALRLIGSIKARAFGEALRAGEHAAPPVGLPSPRAIQRARIRFKLAKVPPAADPAAVRKALPADVALIEYYALPDRLLIFWLDHAGVTAKTIPVERATLKQTGDTLLSRIRKTSATYVEPAGKLGVWLLDPIATQLNEARSKEISTLIVVPHGPLHPISFEALPWAGGLLVDQFAIVSAANLTAVQTAQNTPPKTLGAHTLAVGDAKKDLPGARTEAEEVARIFKGKALIGAQAHETAVREAMRGADLLHFAVHGIRPDAKSPAYLALAPDSGTDGNLQADELATEQLEAALVVLSVCNSARGLPNQGDEIVGVIDRAFLRAGARSVVASRWPVHDAASVLFMRQFYGGLRAGRPVLRAFHDAQLALRRKQARPAQLGPLLARLDGQRVRGYKLADKKPLPNDFAHPYFWAAFSLRGAWR